MSRRISAALSATRPSERGYRIGTALAVVGTLLPLSLVLGYAALTPEEPKTQPVYSTDWTVAPCAWWADDADPELPEYTRTDVCVTDDGMFSHSDGTVTHRP